jgi:hypothetical protein
MARVESVAQVLAVSLQMAVFALAFLKAVKRVTLAVAAAVVVAAAPVPEV